MSNRPAVGGRPEQRHGPDGGDHFVLIVDDDDLVRSGATRCLERLGYRTAAASDADKALEMLRSGEVRADLLFTDIRMPGTIDGVDLAQIVRREFPEIAILLTTGFAGNRPQPPDTRILYKPYKIADLDHAVRDSLAGHDRPA
ncbi:MAG TPA: response regulator [Vineibacter sp.]|nr:response regulator [Vineibacter sp.]